MTGPASPALLVAALFAGAAAALLAGPGSALGPRGVLGDHPGPRMAAATSPADRSAPALRWARPAGALAGLGVWALLGGPVGLLAGAAVALVVPPMLGRLETAAARRERLALIRAAPLVADLLAGALAAGIPAERVLPVLADALAGPAGRALAVVDRRMRLGEPAADAWSALAATPGLDVVARAVARSSRTGAPLAGLLLGAAAHLRAQAAAAALAEVRATAVRAVLPLGLCLLPAFVLLGILPVVGGLIPSL